MCLELHSGSNLTRALVLRVNAIERVPLPRKWQCTDSVCRAYQHHHRRSNSYCYSFQQIYFRGMSNQYNFSSPASFTFQQSMLLTYYAALCEILPNARFEKILKTSSCGNQFDPTGFDRRLLFSTVPSNCTPLVSSLSYLKIEPRKPKSSKKRMGM